MKGVVLVVFSTIIISLTDAQYSRKPNIEIFEIRENQLNKNLNVKPVKLQYNLESDEVDSLSSKLKNILVSMKKKKTKSASNNIVEKLNAMKKFPKTKKIQQQPVVLILSPDNLDLVDSNSDRDILSSFLDETRTQDYLTPGREVLFNIVPPRVKPRKPAKQPNLSNILRGGDFMEDRTLPPPPPRSGHGPYASDENY